MKKNANEKYTSANRSPFQ